MIKARSELQALAIALDKGQSYGISVFDGRYYVGTLKQLEKIGAVSIETPYHPNWDPEPCPS